MFRFAHPHILWALLIIPVMVVVLIIIGRMRRHALRRFGNPALLKELMPDRSTTRTAIKSTLFILSVALLILAAARPQFGSKLREERAEGVEMMLVVDVSNSMLAEDFAPNRLERTRYAIDRLFSSLKQDRVGLVVFAGEAKVQLPITTDYRMARSFAKRLSPDLVSVQGTELGQAISLAALSFSQEGDAGRAMILITDGEAHDAVALEAARRAAEQGIRIFAIGIGTPEGAPIRINGEFIKDERDEMVVSRLNEQMLTDIAQATGGAYVRASNAAFGLEEIVAEINKIERGELTSQRFDEYDEQFTWLVAIAFALLLLEALLLDRRSPRLRRFNIFRT